MEKEIDIIAMTMKWTTIISVLSSSVHMPVNVSGYSQVIATSINRIWIHKDVVLQKEKYTLNLGWIV